MKYTEEKTSKSWDRWVMFAGRYRSITWLAFLTVSLILLWNILPPAYRASLWRSLQSRSLPAVMLAAFSLLTLSLLWNTGQRLDNWGFSFLNMRGRRPRWLDWLMVAITQIGNGLTAFIISIFLYYRDNRRLAYELMLGILSLWLMVELVKALVQRPRPAYDLAEARMVGFRDPGRSFPSGHTSQAFFMATLFVQRLAPEAGMVFLLYFLAVVVGLTRMYVGAHYPRDVLAGAIMGSAWGLMLGMIELSS